jgi:hypothetical protein
MTAPAIAANAAAAATPDALFTEVYQRLKAMASRQLATRGRRETLDTTALVHELYLRVNNNGNLAFAHPAQFFAYATRAMRCLLHRLRQRRVAGVRAQPRHACRRRLLQREQPTPSMAAGGTPTLFPFDCGQRQAHARAWPMTQSPAEWHSSSMRHPREEPRSVAWIAGAGAAIDSGVAR